MKAKRTIAFDQSKARTGIEGFDEMTHGGLPRGRTTLIEGGPGCGKTIMSLQSLLNGFRLDNDPGIFVCFEESPARIQANAKGFGWDLEALKKGLFFSMHDQVSIQLCPAASISVDYSPFWRPRSGK